MDVNGKLSSDYTSALVDEKKYRKLVESLIFLCNTRPDLCYVVGVLSRFSNLPRQNHWQAGMRLLKYLKGTLHYGIAYGKGNTLNSFFATQSGQGIVIPKNQFLDIALHLDREFYLGSVRSSQQWRNLLPKLSTKQRALQHARRCG